MCFSSSISRHTRCALVTGVQTCALPIFGFLEAAAAAEEMLSPFRDVDLVDPRLLLALRHDLVREFLDDAAERDEAVDRVDVVLAAHMLRLEKPVGDRHPQIGRAHV